MNLLTNAYRYGGASVLVEGHRADGYVYVTVSDDGVGVPADLVPVLFERYSRGVEAGGDGGSGLGLSIVRALVQAFGGRIWYTPRKPAGACFTLALPVPGSDGDAELDREAWTTE